MSDAGEGAVPAQPRPRVEIVVMPLETLDALADGDVAAANTSSPVRLPEGLVLNGWVSTWQRRSRQVRDDPAVASWVTGAVVDLESGVVVGRAGFHGPPDERGMVEVGYAILPDLRRRGYARATLSRLLERATAEPSVRVVRASVSPTNEASLALVRSCGFVAVGEQWDPDDGLEIVHEAPSGRGERSEATERGRSPT